MEQSTFPELPVSEEPGQSSPTPSCDSMKSDMSKYEPLSFDGNNSPWSEDQGRSSPASSSMMCSTSRNSPISDARRGGVRQTREDTENTPLSPRSKALKKPSEVVGGHKAGLGSILKPQHQVRSLIGLSPARGSDAVDKKHLTTPKARRRRSKSDDRKENAEIHVKKCKTSGVKSPTTEEPSIYWKLKAKALQARVEKLEEENRSLKKQLQEKSAAEPGVRCTNTQLR